MLNKNYTYLVGLFVASVVWTVFASANGAERRAQTAAVSKEISQLVKSHRASEALETESQGQKAARFTLKDGYLRSLGAPEGQFFPVANVVKNNPAVTARNFIAEQRAAFGIRSRWVDFLHKKSRRKTSRSYERFQQTYSEIQVFGAEIIIQLDKRGGVEFVLSDIMRNTKSLDAGIISIIPAISADDAEFLAIEFMKEEMPSALLQSTDATLMIYQPSVIGNVGSTRLVWQTEVTEVPPISHPIDEYILINAHTGQVALHFTQIKEAKLREVEDLLTGLSRLEGNPPLGIPDVDDCYDYLGDTYDFYFNEHGRDSIDDAGMPLVALVNLPFPNAYWNGFQMLFGEGFVADDVTAHELTHGVTQYESNLIYVNESGAINESFSDMWGEWIDLTNGAGNDDPSVRWLMGEDLPAYIGAIRNMAEPNMFGHPDSKCSPLWYEGPMDNGGVHWNCGVGNKLCYLLTDGDTFNGQTVTGMGISTVADLMYEVQTNLLTAGSDYADLHTALIQAAINLRWSEEDITNLEAACLATELTSCFPVPPVAYPGTAMTRVGTPLELTLAVSDDGLPNPPGLLTYIITSLPANGYLSDPGGGGIIDSNDLPYSLVDSGSQVTYVPDADFSGLDSFDFKGNDGGIFPEGGDSNVETFSIIVASLIFSEDFEEGLGDFSLDEPNGLWHLTSTCKSTELNHSLPTSLYYGLDDICSYDAGSSYGYVTSPVISLNGTKPPVWLGFNYFLETEGFAGFDLAALEVSEEGGPFYEYLSNEAGTLKDPSGGWVSAALDLSLMAGSDIQLRFAFDTVDSMYNDFPGFYVDDVKVYGYGAEDGRVRTEIDTPVEISLVATDDGLPDPPGALTYIITSLPANGTLNDPGAGVIDSNSLPYTLVGFGNQVVYTPDILYTGPDQFHFKANDGGDPPLDGDSNIATISIEVDDLTVILFEDFEGGLGEFTIGKPDGLWHLASSCASLEPGHSVPMSLFYGLDATCNYGDGTTEGIVMSPVIDLSDYKSPIFMQFNYLLETENYPGVDLATVEVSQNGGLFYPYLSNDVETLDDPSFGWTRATLDLSSMAGMDIQIRFRFRTIDDQYNEFPGFYIDDVILKGALAVLAPWIISTPVTDAIVDQHYTYDVEATGVPDPVFSLMGAPSGMIIDPNTGLIHWIPNISQLGPNPVQIVASNGVLPDAIQSFSINVVRAGVAPEIVSEAETNAVFGELYSYDVEATGIPAPTFSLVDPPVGMIIDPISGLIEWMPALFQLGPNAVMVVASNGVLPDEKQEFTVNVAGIPPEIISTGKTIAIVDQFYSYDVDATGIPAPTYSLTDPPAGMTIDSGSGLIQWIPDLTQLGSNSVEVVASNGWLPDANQVFSITVYSTGVAPKITSEPVTTTRVRELYTYNVEATGIPAPTFSLVTPPSGMSIHPVSGLIQWTPDPSQFGRHSVTVRANNGWPPTDDQSFEINVREDPVYFADPNLEMAVESELGLLDPGPTDMLVLSSLDAQNLMISDLTGMEYALNLNVLNVSRNQIIDLSPLLELKNLIMIDLSDNTISNLKPLLSYSGVISLDLTENPLGQSAYCVDLPAIKRMNPGIDLRYDLSTYVAKQGDCDGDCDVDLYDFSILSDYWLQIDCGICGGADLTGDNNVDLNDLEIFALNWLEGVDCAGDCDGDCDVDLNDFYILSNNWLDIGCGTCGGADLTGDNNVDIDDLMILVYNWLSSL